MKRLYLVAERDLESLDQVMVFEDENKDEALEKAIREWSKKNSQEEYFRDYVNEGKDSPTFSINETLYKCNGEYDPDITNEEFVKNVDELFKDKEVYKQQYLGYINGNDVLFSDSFYEYVCVRLCQMGEWAEFEVKPLEIID
ncbi:hypothetical protein ACDI16_04300 [Oceanobacillus caeni]|uniref:hypothetical protein n=1 Tax=Virgibacillus sp. SK37 TaxID=403957 RepID=UPI0011AAE4B9|nr:hypothetical protein [Virgibacillus sp. SK37]